MYNRVFVITPIITSRFKYLDAVYEARMLYLPEAAGYFGIELSRPVPHEHGERFDG